MVTHGCQEVSGADKSEPAQPEELQVCPLISNAKMKPLVLGCQRYCMVSMLVASYKVIYCNDESNHFL